MSTEKQPTVKVTPTFKAGEKVNHKDTGKTLEIIKVHPSGGLQCKGLVALITPNAVEKIV